ncbi:MAG: hypothetical protein H6673_06220 [Anaerolineales bacterium]|nr:hypothetical protein [Anaerolineales bacterium]
MSKQRTPYKALFNLFGAIVALVSVGFVVLQLRHHANETNLTALSLQTWLSIGILAIIYGLSASSLSVAWGFLLKHLQLPMPWHWVVRIYGLSQLAKYLPGNILQMAGRQAMGQAEGLPAWPLAKSTVLELALIALVGGLFSALLLPLISADPTTPLLNILASLLFSTLMVGFVLIVRQLLSASAAKAVAIYAVFLFLTGVIFFFTLRLIEAKTPSALLSVIVGAYVIAWLLGLITPGAPAGIGIREVVLYALLSTQFDQPTILTAVVLGRIITVSGDFLFFLAALGLSTLPTAPNKVMPHQP